MATANYSVYGIPVYYILSLLPHALALKTVATSLKGNNKIYDNRTPRSASSIESLKRQVPAETFAFYERAEGAHKNGMENLPLITAAIILGNMAKLPPQTMNVTVGAYLATRVVYTYFYLTGTTRKRSLVRTGVWNLSIGLCLFLIIKSAAKLKNSEVLGL